MLAVALAVIMALPCSFVSYAEGTEEITDSASWNTAIVDESAIPTFEDFPLRINKNIPEEMKLTLSFHYLKNINSDDNVTVTVTKQSDDSVVYSGNLTANVPYFSISDVPNDEYYVITLNETLNGESNEYVGYIRTKNVTADFPVSMTLGDNVISSQINADWSDVKIKKVGDLPQCNHNEDEECTYECGYASVIDVLHSDDMNNFYNSLDENCYYEMQTTATIDGVSKLYQAFISTHSDGEYDGVFTRGYEFSIEPFSDTATYGLARSVNLSLNINNAITYPLYRELEVMQSQSTNVYTVKFIPPQVGYYVFETIGNADTVFAIYDEINGVLQDGYSVVRSGGTGENARYRFGTLLNGTNYSYPVKYIVMSIEDGSSPAPYSFRITREIDGEVDDVTNHFSEVRAQVESGTFSTPTNEKTMNYYGDVDVYGYRSKVSGNGYFKISSPGNSTSANAYMIDQTVDGADFTWMAMSATSSSTNYIRNFSAGNYYIEVHQTTSTLPDYDTSDPNYYDEHSYTYEMDFYTPTQYDETDLATHPRWGNSTPIYVTEIDCPYTNSNLTLNKGDCDYFKVTTGDNGGDIVVRVFETNAPSGVTSYLYIPKLYDRDDIVIVDTENPEWTSATSLTTYTTTVIDDKNVNILEYNGLAANHDYLIEINRPNSSSYDSYYKYTLEVTLVEPEIPTATLSSNVTLNHTAQTTISNLDAMYSAVMENLTCYINGEAVSDADALEDVMLYYNDTELTPSMVSVMGANSYSLTVKYRDVEATGGSVTLVVETTQSEDDIVMLENIPSENVTNPVWDWAAVARMMANTRLLREGSSQTTKTIPNAIMQIKPGALTTRGSGSDVAQAANYFYSNGSVDTYNFINDVVDVATAESTLYNAIDDGQMVVMQLTSVTAPEDVSAMRYIALCGVNATDHTYFIYDPILTTSTTQPIEVSQDVIHNGGYLGNTNLRFTGKIIEFA